MNGTSYVPTLIVGASMLGLGIAASEGSEAVVLEPSNGIANEYVRSYKLRDVRYSAVTPAGKELQKDLYARNLTDDEGRMHLQGLMPVMFKYVRDAGIRLHMQTSVVEVARRGERWEVLIGDASGLRVLETDRILDTTSRCVTAPRSFQASAKYLNLLVAGLSDKPRMTELGGYPIRRGRFDRETFLAFAVDPMDDWLTARDKLFRFWLDRPSELQSCAFVTHADEFDYEFEQPGFRVEDGWDWLPSAYYHGPLEAFDQGVLRGKGGKAQ